MTHTNTTFSNTTAKNTAEMQLLTGDNGRSEARSWLPRSVSCRQTLKTTALLMLVQTCPQLPVAQSHDTGPHYKHWARLRLLIDDDVTVWHSDSWLQLPGQKAGRRASSPGGADQWRVWLWLCDLVRAPRMDVFKRLWNL